MSRFLFRLSILAALFLSVSLHAQQKQEWYIGKPIADFAFTGLNTVVVGDLQPIVKPYIGKNFTMDLFWEIQGKLFALDSFESIEGEAKEKDETRTAVIVSFTVKERPTVTAIEFIGNNKVRNGDILDKIIVKKGDLVSQAKVKADETAIVNLYLEKGYNNVTASGKFTTNEKENTAVVTFEISEGVQTTIKEIRFSGNSFASESTLRNLIKSKPQAFLSSGSFQEAKLEEDKKAVVTYYSDHGYVDAKVERIDREIQSKEGKNYLVLTVFVSEGEQWTYGGLEFSGNSVFSTEKLSSLVRQKPGKIISIPKLQQDTQRVTELYYENGYIFNGFDLKDIRDDKTKTISYVMKIVERDKAHIENIIFKGNKRTKNYVLERELAFEEGDIFNKAEILNGLRNLYYLQYFSSVQPETPIGSAEGLMNVVFNVEEQSTANIQFGAVFSGGEFPVSGNIKWNESNLGGRGQTFGINLEASPIRQTVAFTFVEPWLTGKRWSAGIRLSFSHAYLDNVLQDFDGPTFTDDQWDIAAPDPYETREKYLDAIQSGETIDDSHLMRYDSWDIGIGLTSGYRWTIPIGYFGIKGGINSKFRYISYDSDIYRPYDITVRANLDNWNIIDQLYVTFYLDGRDNPLSPVRGYQINQSFVYTGGFLFGSRQYNRTDSFVEGFLTLLNAPVTDSWSLMFVLAAHSGVSFLLPQYGYFSRITGGRSSWGWTDPLVDSSDLLYIDGMTVARGWGQMYGQALWDNKVELRMPISKEILWGVWFFDMAGIWTYPSDMAGMGVEDLLFSYGMGLRFTIPQFPIRLYLDKKFQIINGRPVYDTTSTFGNKNSFWNFNFTISIGGDVF